MAKLGARMDTKTKTAGVITAVLTAAGIGFAVGTSSVSISSDGEPAAVTDAGASKYVIEVPTSAGYVTITVPSDFPAGRYRIGAFLPSDGSTQPSFVVPSIIAEAAYSNHAVP